MEALDGQVRQELGVAAVARVSGIDDALLEEHHEVVMRHQGGRLVLLILGLALGEVINELAQPLVGCLAVGLDCRLGHELAPDDVKLCAADPDLDGALGIERNEHEALVDLAGVSERVVDALILRVSLELLLAFRLRKLSSDMSAVALQVSEDRVEQLVLGLEVVDHIRKILNLRMLVADLPLERLLQDHLQHANRKERTLARLDTADESVNVLQLDVHGLHQDDVLEAVGRLQQS